MKDFERHWPAVLQIPGKPHGGHTPATEFPLKYIAVAEDISKGSRDVAHGHALGGGTRMFPGAGSLAGGPEEPRPASPRPAIIT